MNTDAFYIHLISLSLLNMFCRCDTGSFHLGISAAKFDARKTRKARRASVHTEHLSAIQSTQEP